ncbi:hypothetical protein E2320_004607, partial [Naja naja]
MHLSQFTHPTKVPDILTVGYLKIEIGSLLHCKYDIFFQLQHPGYINFSYEVMTPLKWYQSMIGPQPPQLPQNPHLQQPGPNPFVPLNGHNTLIPHYQSIQHPLQPQAGEHPVQPQPPINPNQSMNPQLPGIANQPMYPLPPLIPDTPLESWPADKTKKEE